MRAIHHLAVVTGLAGTVLLTGGDVSYYEEALPSTMNPLFAQTMVDFRTHELVFDRLLFHSPVTNELTSRLLEKGPDGKPKAERLADPTKIKLFLKTGIRWHDGKDFSGKDVCFTVNAMLDPKTASQVAKDYREAIVGCEEIFKENAVIITFVKPFHNPLERLGFSVLPSQGFDGTTIRPDMDFSHRPIGTGPMKATLGPKSVRFTAFPNAHQNPKIQVMSMQPGGDSYVQIKTLLNAGVSGVISVPPPLRPEVAASDDVALKSYDLRSWWFVALNTAKGALASDKIRQALNLTIDRSELRELTIGVDAEDPNPPCEFISGPFVGSSPYYNRSIKPFERSDRAKARQLLSEAGATEQVGRWVYKGAPISLKIGMNAPLDLEARDLLNQVGNQLQAGGFDRQVYRVTSDDWNTKVVTGQMKDYDMLIGKWSFGRVEDVSPLFHSRGGGKGALNIFDYSNAEVDTILGRFDNARTDTEAQDAYHDLHAFVSKDLPYLFLWKLDTKSAWRNEVRGSIIAPYYYFTDFEKWRYDE